MSFEKHLVNNVREKIVAAHILFNSQPRVAAAKVFSEMEVIFDYLEGIERIHLLTLKHEHISCFK